MRFNKLFFLLIIGLSTQLFATVRIVTTSSDFADIARNVGQSHVEVSYMADGRQDLHRVEPRPSMVGKLRNADLVIVIGMELDSWMSNLLRVAGNPRLQPGKKGYLDASIPIKKIPAKRNTNAPTVGDVHQDGNPHYWLAPANGIIIADQIRDRLIQLDPENKDDYIQNHETYTNKIKTQISKWNRNIAQTKSIPVLSFHSSWDYFLQAFGLQNAGTVEAYPGMGSLGVDLPLLKSKIARGDYAVMIYETAQADANLQLFKHLRSTNLKLVPLTPSVIENTAANTYINLIDSNINALSAAIGSSR